MVWNNRDHQFPDVVEFCEDMANAGKTVIVAALDGTFQRKVLWIPPPPPSCQVTAIFSLQPFGNILNLVPLAESVVKLKAVCMVCYNDAAFTRRLGSETEVSVSCTPALLYTSTSHMPQIELVGGMDKYMAVCRSCYSMSSPHLVSTTPIRGGDVTSGRQLFPDHEHAIPMHTAS